MLPGGGDTEESSSITEHMETARLQKAKINKAQKGDRPGHASIIITGPSRPDLPPALFLPPS